MQLDDKAKNAAKRLGDAINSAIGSSAEVVDAIEYLRSVGYEPHLQLKLEIALARTGDTSEPESFELELTAEDIRTLERMKIRFE